MKRDKNDRTSIEKLRKQVEKCADRVAKGESELSRFDERTARDRAVRVDRIARDKADLKAAQEALDAAEAVPFEERGEP